MNAWPHCKLMKPPLPWGCLPTAFCVATGIPFYEWINCIGHDGSQIVFEFLPEPQNRRGFHPQELIKAALTFGVAVTELQVNPIVTTDGKNRYPVVYRGGNAEAFSEALRGQRAVIGGITRAGLGHAAAWDGELGLLFDGVRSAPARLYDEGFKPTTAYILHRISLTSGR